MNKPKDQDDFVMRTLVGQVCTALMAGVVATGQKSLNERDVVTYITRPMWRAFCRGCGMPENCNPTEWKGLATRRVYGSETIIVESDEMWSASRIRPGI